MHVKKYTFLGFQFLAVAALVALVAPTTAEAGRFRSAVGGVAISADGVLSEPSRQANALLVNRMKEMVQPAAGEMAEASELRRVSLRHVMDMVTKAAQSETELPAEVRYLAGLQRIKYVFVYPEQQDIVLAGPGEGWVVNNRGEVVGRSTGLPVLHLEDLLIALRTSEQARNIGISCSIDPRPQGVARMNRLIGQQKTFQPSVLKQIEQVMGPQDITVTGVPADSHFARVLVAAGLSHEANRYGS